MTSELRPIVEAFSRNVAQISALMNFDQEVQDHAIRIVDELRKTMDPQLRHSEILQLDNHLRLLRNVRDHDSLRPRYRHVRNHCVVLLVSYFAAAMRDLFTRCLEQVVATGAPEELSKQELKLTVAELSGLGERSVAELFVDKRDISFQDMQSIARAFSEFVGVEIKPDRDVSNIIVAQACRHALVHSGGLCDRKTLNQIRAAGSNNLDIQLNMNAPIELTEQQIQIVENSMVSYMTRVARLVSERTSS